MKIEPLSSIVVSLNNEYYIATTLKNLNYKTCIMYTMLNYALWLQVCVTMMMQ